MSLTFELRYETTDSRMSYIEVNHFAYVAEHLLFSLCSVE